MRQAFAYEAELVMAPDADARAPGAAITVALCGHWDHEPPCPLAPHHSQAERVGSDVRVRTLFAVEPDKETGVRQLIDNALRDGELDGPDNVTTRWELRRSHRAEVSAQETDHAASLIQTTRSR